MTLAEFVERLVTLGASPSVIAVTVEYVTQRDGISADDEKKRKSALRSRNYRGRKKAAKSVTSDVAQRDASRDGATSISSSSFLPSFSSSEERGNREESKGLVVPREADDWPADYEGIFWNAYPRRVGRKTARAKLRLIRQRGEVTFVKLMAGVHRYAAACKSIELQYVKHPATWLNCGGWDDEHMPEASNGYGRSRPLQDDSKSISAAAGRLAELAERGEFAFGPRPSLLPDKDEDAVLLLPQGRGTRP